MRAQLYKWLKTNRIMLINAGSLVCTTLVTGVLGFAYWWVAARQFQPAAVGLASAAVSAMLLLGTISVLGLGTLLIGELPRQPGKEASLISTALILVGAVGGLTGMLFALVAPFVSADLRPLGTNVGNVLLFGAGVSLTSITIVLDQALIGLLRGELQFWRNTLFAATKLATLFAIGLWLHFFILHNGGEGIYATWAIGNGISLLPLAAFVLIKKSSSLKHAMPDWSLLRKLGLSALQHHMLNLIQQVPTMALPVLVTILLSTTKNAWFYIAWMISGFVFTAAYALTTVLYAINATETEELARKMRLTLNLALITSIGANIVIQVGATQILGLFGHTYAQQAAWSLRIVSLAAFPMIFKFHYIAVSRIDKKLLSAMLPVALGSLLELGAASLGAHLGDLVGLSLGWTIAVCIEAVFMSPAVFKALRFHPSESISLATTLPLQTQPLQDILSTKKQEELQRSLSIAALDTHKMTKVLLAQSTFASDDEEETELLPIVSVFTFYKMARTRPLPVIPAELEMQKLLSLSTAVTDKHKQVRLQPPPDTPTPTVEWTAKRRRLPKTSASIVDTLAETQRLPGVPDSSSELYCVKCHALLPANAISCSSCSTQLDKRKNTDQEAAQKSAERGEGSKEHASSHSISCPQCHAILPTGAKFCGVCGKHIEEIDEAQSDGLEEHQDGTKQPLDGTKELLDGLEEHQDGLEKHFDDAKEPSALSTVRAIVTVVLPLCALIVWFFSLPTVAVHIRNMTDLGMVSILPPATIIAPFLVTISFCLTTWQKKERTPVILLHLLILIFMLYGITALVEAVPRFAIVYRHAGYTDYIIRHGGVDPTLDAYFNWPGFFIFSAFLTRIAGYNSILPYAAWSPFFLNLIYFIPLYLIFTTATTDKRIVWFGIWFFYLTNWIAQDYFSPQGLNFFLYLVIIAILVKWFKAPPKDQPQTLGPRWRHLGPLYRPMQGIYGWLTAPDTSITPSSPQQRVALLVSLIAIFGLIVFSHPLTPFLTIPGVTLLIFFQRCKPFWLPILMIVMTGAWILTMAQPYLAGHLSTVIGDFSHLDSIFTQNVTQRTTQGDSEHNFISDIRLLMTAFIWGLAFIGGILRLRKGYQDATYVLLAIAPFPVILLQSYGGEMLLRIYLFTLPMMTLFTAAIFFTPSSRKGTLWAKGAILVTCFVLLGAFFFTRYGNERMDYITPEELAGVHHLYSIAPPDSLFLEAWDGAPLQLQAYEIDNTDSLGEIMPDAIMDRNVNAIIHYIRTQGSSRTYMIITRAERATSEGDGLAPGTLDRLEMDLLKSKKFVQIYTNRDAQIFVFVG